MSKYPTVNYIGNKEKIAEWIVDNFPIKNGKVLDLFAGGQSISYTLKERGYQVISNDALYSDFVIGKAIIENDDVLIDESVLDTEVLQKEIEKKYKDINYLSDRIYYDNEVKELAKMLVISDKITNEYQHYMFLTLIRRSMVRKIPYSRMNVQWKEIQKFRDEAYCYEKYKRRRSYQNYTFKKLIRDNISEYNNAVFSNGKTNKCYNYDVFKMLDEIDGDVDAIYMDPPYPTTMNKYNDFYGLIDKAMGHESNYVDFTNKNTFLQNLENLIKKSIGKTRYILISVSNRTKPSVEELVNMMNNYGTTKTLSKEYQYKVTGKENKNKATEMLIILTTNKK